MYPILFRIGDFPITTFGVMMFVSFIAGSWVAAKMLERYGLHPGLIWDMLAWIAIAGIVGAKIYYLVLHWPTVIANPLDEILSREGLVWYGGLMGGVLAYYLQVRARKLPVAVMFDATAPALFLAIACGRIGCFLVGDDYGLFTDGPFGVAFPEGIPPSTAGYLRSIGGSIPASIPNSSIVPVHPTQLYEVAIVVFLFAVLWELGKRRLKPGQLFALFMGFYAVERFLIEFVRAKADRFVFGLSTAQAISIALFLGAFVLWHHQKSKPDGSHELPTPAPAIKPTVQPG
jgi:phosphatidylglycerol:prolipoprotein diacylglycerol transferase